jgi:antitoxin component YwqK of YwqJK toxin-antitoxin module
MKNIIYIIISLLFLNCENNNSRVDTDQLPPLKEVDNIKIITQKEDTIIQSKLNDSTHIKTDKSINNQKDTNGLKQGIWITKGWKNKTINISNYINDTLNGYYFDWKGGQTEGNYLNGKKNGYFRHYYGNKEDSSVLAISLYKLDSLIWTGYPACDKRYIVNVKGFHSSLDSTFIEVPHMNGNIWYRGALVNNLEVGEHYIYKENGKLYATVDYDSKQITEYDSIENIKKTYSMEKYKLYEINLKN